ncbi:hypothetical protein H6G54_25465 [Anabaena cylindrica FACHB-243]|uniref:Uncharacterized protein n=1 Tax=Anabaena cylindrica (strain ATCC 27899 / PCC 7122) TaxID=272123 RepID=K9ZDN1_ANACC|nr:MULTISPECIES: hypothetical protein [Anabaena]AFZ57318.1 hypothetical protein Anacy_1828 [Anabaena cylindrica PCC 7122]MBD2420986.1 hypothetical protein [Anabaena cylindrica FACHB-243]MBY5284744.1 hypothetical protein [Anabaena sp. CCAP 1446/1C]MBY5308340.1 hypothetical protein [Anabaena sp. CCAP 1446/1C]MCM2405739.1 hypothetical protein [Anabaena sp. CCAP 1446/1C]
MSIIIICPGIHEPELTENFITGLLSSATDIAIKENNLEILVYPGQGILTLSAFHILQFLSDAYEVLSASQRSHDKLKCPVIFISYSAGVVGAIIAATKWQMLGGTVKAFIAIDGWGMPLWGNFPIHRMSHDYFTHWSSAILGGGEDNFYAEPPVNHLSMWHSPQTVQGKWVDRSLGLSLPQNYLNAAEFLHLLLKRYEEKSLENKFSNQK